MFAEQQPPSSGKTTRNNLLMTELRKTHQQAGTLDVRLPRARQ